MTFFSRLTDIVTCNLTELLSNEDDPQAALQQIVNEMEEGVAGANRSVATATANEQRLAQEVQEHSDQAEVWQTRAKEELSQGDENAARLALVRKQEVDALIAGLQQQQQAAVATREHLTTMLNALGARLADARRRLNEIDDSPESPATTETEASVEFSDAPQVDSGVDEELQKLKRELGQLES